MSTDRADVVRRFHQTLEDSLGPGAVAMRPSPISGFELPKPSNYLEAIRVARYVADVVTGEMRSYVAEARGEGTSWSALAAVLPLAVEKGDDEALAAFEWTAPRPSMPHDPVILRWTCAACGKRISDTGPYGSHPDDNETGHAEDCTRHAEDVREWRERTGWDED